MIEWIHILYFRKVVICSLRHYLPLDRNLTTISNFESVCQSIAFVFFVTLQHFITMIALDHNSFLLKKWNFILTTRRCVMTLKNSLTQIRCQVLIQPRQNDSCFIYIFVSFVKNCHYQDHYCRWSILRLNSTLYKTWINLPWG